jgi:hypothetical protein
MMWQGSGAMTITITAASEAAEKLIAAYNAKDFDAMAQMIAPDIDFAHFNRNFVLNSRDALLDVLRGFAASYVPDRHFEAPERVTVAGNIVVREAWYVGTAAVDLPGFGAAGEGFRLKFCSVMRFDDAGVLVEWKDHG